MLIFTKLNTLTGVTHKIRTFTFCSSREQLLTVDGQNVRLWSLQSQIRRTSLAAHRTIIWVEYSPEYDVYIAVSSSRIMILDHSLDVIYEAVANKLEIVRALYHHADSKLITVSKDGGLYVWQIEVESNGSYRKFQTSARKCIDTDPTTSLEEHKTCPAFIFLDKDSSSFYTFDENTLIRWSLNTYSNTFVCWFDLSPFPPVSPSEPERISCIYLLDSETVITGFISGHIALWKFGTDVEDLCYCVSRWRAHKESVVNICLGITYGANNALLSTTASGTMLAFYLPNGQPLPLTASIQSSFHNDVLKNISIHNLTQVFKRRLLIAVFRSCICLLEGSDHTSIVLESKEQITALHAIPCDSTLNSTVLVARYSDHTLSHLAHLMLEGSACYGPLSLHAGSGKSGSPRQSMNRLQPQLSVKHGIEGFPSVLDTVVPINKHHKHAHQGSSSMLDPTQPKTVECSCNLSEINAVSAVSDCQNGLMAFVDGVKITIANSQIGSVRSYSYRPGGHIHNSITEGIVGGIVDGPKSLLRSPSSRVLPPSFSKTFSKTFGGGSSGGGSQLNRFNIPNHHGHGLQHHDPNHISCITVVTPLTVVLAEDSGRLHLYSFPEKRKDILDVVNTLLDDNPNPKAVAKGSKPPKADSQQQQVGSESIPKRTVVAHNTPVIWLRFDKTRGWLVSASEDGFIKFWQLPQFRLVGYINTKLSHNISSILHVTSNLLTVGLHNGGIHTFHLPESFMSRLPESWGAVQKPASRTGSRMNKEAVQDESTIYIVFPFESTSVVNQGDSLAATPLFSVDQATHKSHPHVGAVTCLAGSDVNLFVSASHDHTVIVWKAVEEVVPVSERFVAAARPGSAHEDLMRMYLKQDEPQHLNQPLSRLNIERVATLYLSGPINSICFMSTGTHPRFLCTVDDTVHVVRVNLEKYTLPVEKDEGTDLNGQEKEEGENDENDKDGKKNKRSKNEKKAALKAEKSKRKLQKQLRNRLAAEAAAFENESETLEPFQQGDDEDDVNHLDDDPTLGSDLNQFQDEEEGAYGYEDGDGDDPMLDPTSESTMDESGVSVQSASGHLKVGSRRINSKVRNANNNNNKLSKAKAAQQQQSTLTNSALNRLPSDFDFANLSPEDTSSSGGSESGSESGSYGESGSDALEAWDNKHSRTGKKANRKSIDPKLSVNVTYKAAAGDASHQNPNQKPLKQQSKRSLAGLKGDHPRDPKGSKKGTVRMMTPGSASETDYDLIPGSRRPDSRLNQVRQQNNNNRGEPPALVGHATGGFDSDSDSGQQLNQPPMEGASPTSPHVGFRGKYFSARSKTNVNQQRESIQGRSESPTSPSPRKRDIHKGAVNGRETLHTPLTAEAMESLTNGYANTAVTKAWLQYMDTGQSPDFRYVNARIESYSSQNSKRLIQHPIPMQSLESGQDLSNDNGSNNDGLNYNGLNNNGFNRGSTVGSNVGSNIGFNNGFSTSAAAGAAHALPSSQRLLSAHDPKLISELYSTDLWDEDGHLRFTGEYPPINNHHHHNNHNLHSPQGGSQGGSRNDSYNNGYNGGYNGVNNGSHSNANSNFLQTPNNRLKMVHSSGSIPTRTKSPLGSREEGQGETMETVTQQKSAKSKRQVKINSNVFSVQSVFGHPPSTSSYTGPGARSRYHPRALRPFATSMKGSATSYTADDFIHRENPLVSIAPEKPVEMSRYNGDTHMRSTENLMRSLRLPQPMRNSLALWNSPSAPRLSSLVYSKSPLRNPTHSTVAVQVSFDDDEGSSSGNRFLNRRNDEQRTRFRTDPRHIVSASVYHTSSTPVLPRFN